MAIVHSTTMPCEPNSQLARRKPYILEIHYCTNNIMYGRFWSRYNYSVRLILSLKDFGVVRIMGKKTSRYLSQYVQQALKTSS